MHNQTLSFEQNQASVVGLDIVQHLQTVARSVLDPLIPEYSEVVVLDYPNNTNVGDSLIWLGEMAYLKSRKVKILYVCDIKNYNQSQLRSVVKKDTLILMHGGGNFGTVWTEIHQFRLHVLREFSNHTIIQFPQTLSFSDEPPLGEVANVLKIQSNYHLIVRSKASQTLARSHFDCHVHLCPDMAFLIGSVSSPVYPKVDVLVLSRTDHEKSSDSQLDQLQIHDKGILCADWLEESIYERMLRRVEMHSWFIRKRLDKNNLFLAQLWNKLSLVRMQRGMALLGMGKLIVTDRLHAHILSILMDKPHIFTDNSYGKLSDFYQTWTHHYAEAYWLHNNAEIAERLIHLLKREFRAE